MKIRNICFALAVIVIVLTIAISIYDAFSMWNNEFKSESFDSFIEYYFTREKGFLSIGASASSIIFAISLFLRSRI